MDIRKMRLVDLLPADYNPRKALKKGDPEYEKLRRSIEQFGMVEPVIWNERTATLVGGHQRVTVLIDMGVEETEVSVVDLDLDHEKALNVALNKITGSWDEKLLESVLRDLNEADLADLTGFDEVELDNLIGEQQSKAERAPTAEETTPLSLPGDVWLLGEHRLMCGDSCSEHDMAVLMDGQVAKLVITDPPYNVNYGDKAEMLEEYLGSGNRITSRIMNDNMDDASFYQFLLSAYQRMYESMAPGAGIYVFHAETEGINFRTAFNAAGFKLSQCLIWVKSSLVIGRNDYQWRHEPILYGWRSDGSHKWYGGRKKNSALLDGGSLSVQHTDDGDVFTFSDGYTSISIRSKDYDVLEDGRDAMSSVIYHEKPRVNDLHPTMKPVGLVAKLLRNSSKKGDLVLDPFGGSGSTMIACEEHGRINCTMEMDPFYCDQIVKRYIDFTARPDVFVLRDGVKIPYAEVPVNGRLDAG